VFLEKVAAAREWALGAVRGITFALRVATAAR
jgi:hypothetical protein